MQGIYPPPRNQNPRGKPAVLSTDALVGGSVIFVHNVDETLHDIDPRLINLEYAVSGYSRERAVDGFCVPVAGHLVYPGLCREV